jgi:hypothetical protein
MKITYTAAGTPVIEQTREEYAAHLEREVHKRTGMSVAAFTAAYVAGKLDDADPPSASSSVCCVSDRMARDLSHRRCSSVEIRR